MVPKCPVLPIVLPPPEYRRLQREARANERDPVQQARWLLKQALAQEATDRLTDAAPRGPEAA